MKPFIAIFSFILFGLSLSAQPLKELDHQYSSGLFKTDNAHLLSPMYDPAAAGSFNILQYLQGRVPGLQIYNSGFMPTVMYRGTSPTFYIDEIRVDARTVQNIPVNDIALVKVIRPPFIGNWGGGGGAIVVYTIRSDEKTED